MFVLKFFDKQNSAFLNAEIYKYFLLRVCWFDGDFVAEKLPNFFGAIQ